MEITSQGLQSEFIFHDIEGIRTDLGDCISVLTPTNPDYYFGNFLLFPAPPKRGEIGDWMARFDEIFASYPAVRHYTFQWLPTSRIEPAVEKALERARFQVDETSVLSATAVHTDKPAPEGVEFRPIQTDTEWRAVVDSQSRQGFPNIPMQEYRRHKEAMFANYRAMSDRGLGDWWGAFKGDTLVANMGLFFGDGIGRFQSVETAPKHRRQGICRAMVHHVSLHGIATHPEVTLMLHADAQDVARGIYQSVGYEETEVLQTAFRAPVWQ